VWVTDASSVAGVFDEAGELAALGDERSVGGPELAVFHEVAAAEIVVENQTRCHAERGVARQCTV
jgi:hypothetical protein